MPRLPVVLAAVAVAAIAPAAHAQAPADAGERPVAVLRVALDRADAADTALAVTRMPPGWHVTAAAGGAAYDTSHVARGRFRVESELFLFSREPAVGAGVVVGGTRDAAGALGYTAFVVGPDGRFRVTRHEGARSRELVPWTAHPAVVARAAGASNVRERLVVEADDASVRFAVNGTVVATVRRADARPDGAVGLRADPGANAHVATLVVDGRNVAPVAAPKAP